MDQYIEEITMKLNHRPRKRLGFRSPSQVLFQAHGVALQSANLSMKFNQVINLISFFQTQDDHVQL